MRTCSPRLVGLVSVQHHNLYLFPSQAVKTGLLPQEGAMDPGPTNILCLLCRAAPGRQRSNPSPPPPVCPPSSEQLQHHLPGDLGCWQAVLRDEICVPVSCFSRHRVDLSNETLECFMCHLPRASPQSSRLLFLSETNALINLQTLLLDHSNVLFKIIIWKITWQRTLLLFLLWKGARFAEGLRAGLW